MTSESVLSLGADILFIEKEKILWEEED